MKKVLVALVLILVASTVSAAEVTVGAWGRGFFVPYYSDGDADAQSVDTVSWGGTNPRIGMTIAGNSDNVGFQADFNVDGGNVNCGDQQKIWVKPMDMLTISVGRAYDDTLRGNAAFGSWDWLRITGTGEDTTFARVTTYGDSHGLSKAGGKQGAIFALAPTKELYAYLSFNGLGASEVTNGNGQTANDIGTFADAMRNVQVGAGYTINGVGQIRAQYIGNYQSKIDETVADDPATADDNESNAVAEADKSVINAAFKLTAVQNLYADLGFFMPLTADDFGQYDQAIAVYVKYTMGAIGIHVLSNIELGAKDDAGKDATGMEFGLGLDYDLGSGLGVNADVRYQNAGAQQVKDGRIGGMLGVKKGFSNGLVGAGVEFCTTSMQWSPSWGESEKAAESTTIAVPVRVEYWF